MGRRRRSLVFALPLAGSDPCNARLALYNAAFRTPRPARNESAKMKKDTHPKYQDCTVRCGCGATFQMRSTGKDIHVEICSNCHPFYTGQQKYVDTLGRVERFQKKFGGEYFKSSTTGKKTKG